MCVCKKYLHARGAVQAFVENAEKQKMEIEHIDGYSTFFNKMTADCAKAETTYID